jgi:hypothetical protein
VIDKTRYLNKIVLTYKKLKDISVWLRIIRLTSVTWLSLESRVSVRLLLRQLTVPVHIDLKLCMNSNLLMLLKWLICEWVLKSMHDGFVDWLFINDKAYFNITGYIHSQKIWICSDKHRQAVQHIQLRDIKAGVCAISTRRIFGLIFLPRNRELALISYEYITTIF